MYLTIIPPVLESMRAREPGLQAPSNLAGSKIKNTHFSPLINSFSEISNIGKRTHHVSCIYSEGKVIKPTSSKLVAKYAFLQALSKLENQLAGSGADSRTGTQCVIRCDLHLKVTASISTKFSSSKPQLCKNSRHSFFNGSSTCFRLELILS